MVLLPLFKSFADPLILHYLNFKYNMELGFTFGNFEDSPRVRFIDELLSRTGCILLRRKAQNDPTVSYINQSLVQDIVESNSITTLFQNEARSRSGKFNLPFSSEHMVKILVKTAIHLKKLKL